MMLAMPEQGGVMAREDCEHCGAECWHYFSRIEPQSWNAEAFHAQFVIDEEKRGIHPR